MSSSRLKSRRRQDTGFKWARIAIAVLSTIGVIDTGSITLNRWGWIGSLSCPGGLDGCDKVLNSPWGTIFQLNEFSIPLSLLGLLSYLTILILSIIPLIPTLTENKNDISRKTWWGLFFLSCCMAIFSLLLIGIMILQINAFCFFCILSAVLSISILFLTLIGGKWNDPGELIFRGTIISLVVLLSGLIWSSSVDPSRSKISQSNQGIAPAIISKSTSSSIELAKHLTSIGAVSYSAYWCPHCHDQKELFGKEAVSKLLLIECAADGKNNQARLCQEKEIQAFPSWEINGEILSGVRSLNELADLSNYKGPKDF
tara:strand:+ start:15234 stop:16175 length:942 start_codon:yes stop_codon:yes gene_type:complete